jgi:outer membrane protein TolC
MKQIKQHLKAKAFFALLLTLVSCSSIYAQPQTITLKDAVNYALKHKAEARKAQLDLENSKYEIDEVKARALPQVNGTGGLTYNPILQLSALPGELAGQPGTTLLIPFGQKWSTNLGLSVNQAIYDQSVVTGLKAAKTTQEYYQLNTQATDEQVIEAVANNYYQVLVQRQKIVVIDSNIANTAKVKDIIAGQYANGLGKKIDLSRIQVNLSNLNSQRQQLINAMQQQENTLKFYMGMPVETSIDIPQSEFEAIVPKLTEAYETPDVTKRLSYQLLKKQEKLLLYQRQSTKSEYYPTLSFSGNYNYQGIGNKFPIGKGTAQGANWYDYASVGLNLKVPIFNGFSTRSKLKQADISIKKLQEDIDNTNLSLNLEFANAKTQITNSIITLKSQQENVKLAQEVFFNTQNNYNNGLASLTDLLDSESSLTTAQNNYSSALLDYKLAEIQLIKANGNITSLKN